ncbi:MAG TPA: transketolase C-terminal domain-containing protein [Candidatus Hydrogenedentes bacterium]|nr:transketolase C-terminal domain-containing protein [Candidatus Hydrogenedentota bacterium]HPG67401.1 transketolase C-terminal domain-containing protein [Candidatus Hydrogenedentota bacterium]
MSFPIDVSGYQRLTIDPSTKSLSEDLRAQLKTNIQVVRDTIVFYTAIAAGKGLGGHTGGAYSIVPEVLIADAFMRASNAIYPALFDEAGHRVAIQYAMSAFNGVIPFEKLYHYREYGEKLYGHPELDPEVGVTFSSGRLGHLWAFVNGVALAHPEQAVVMFGSDGSQQEGGDAEAARLAVARKLNVKLFLDDNNVTIAGHPKEYLPGYDLEQTLKGHGLAVLAGEGEDLDCLYSRMQQAFSQAGPVAVVNRRLMAPGIAGLEGSNKGHDVISVDLAVAYLESKGYTEAVEYLKAVKKPSSGRVYVGSTKETKNNRDEFGKIVCEIIGKMSPEERKAKVVVIDSDLEGSCGLHHIHKNFPEVFVSGGIAERGNFSAAAGFGFEPGRQGIFATFSAFVEMVLSEVTMARLNKANVIAHFSHAGVDNIADNTCHFGINNFFAATGLVDDDTTRLYFPADAGQLRACMLRIWDDPGVRFVFSTRSGCPFILKEDGSPYFDGDYSFEPGRLDVIRAGKAGYVVSYGELLYRALDAVDRCRAEGLDVGLVNKATLNYCDGTHLEMLGSAPFILVVEGQNELTGLGSRIGSALLKAGHAPKFDMMGVVRAGVGGLAEQITYQGLDPDDIKARIKALA